MNRNLFCFIIFSLTSNFVYPNALSYDSDVKVIEADETVKRNITKVKQTDFEEQEEKEEEDYDIQVKFPKADLTKTEVQFPNELNEVIYENPCLPSPCGRRNYFHWDDKFQGNRRRICLPNYIKSPPKCNPVCPRWCPAEPNPTPCSPSPCGPHSQCREVNTLAICRCQSNFIGTPPNCRRECTINSECASDKACLNRVCVDPCVYKCARNANCTVIAHNPICSCQDGFTGDPFTNCMPLSIPTQRPEVNPCKPSPCGLYSQCQEFNGIARCTCLPKYVSSPPRCRLECTIDSECNAYKACINNSCSDPCPRDCGNYAQCVVKNHISYCTCLPASCQALDQTFDFPRYPELSYNFGHPKEEAGFNMGCYLGEGCGYGFGGSYRVCPSGTVRLDDFCVEIDDDYDNN